MLLTEILWTEQYTAMTVAKQYPRDWIHFTATPKLGVHPSKSHKDPPGIYFYPIRWLLRIEDDDGPGLSQYATHQPYYYICSMTPTPNLITLNQMTARQVQSIATRNGWIADLQRIQANPNILNNKNNPMDKRLLRKPGGLFYACMDYLANVENRPWLQLLAGVDGLIDNGAGIISPNETWQAVVINRSVIKILKFGENKDQSQSLYAQAVQTIATEFGGKFFYKHKVPGVSVEIDGKPITLLFDGGNWAIHLEYYNSAGHWIRKTERYEDGSTGDLETMVGSLRHHIKQVAEGHPVWFKPHAKSAPRNIRHHWDRETLMKLIHLLIPRAQRISTWPNEHGGVEYSVNIDAGFKEHLGLSVEDDNLRVTAEISGMGHETFAEIKPEDNFVLSPTTDVRAAAKEILDHLADQLLHRFGEKVHLLSKRFWFNFRDRLPS